MKKIISFLIPIFVAWLATISTSYFLDRKIDELSSTKDLSQIRCKYGDFAKERSCLIKDVLSKQGDLFLMGSSEMAINVPQNSIKFFPFKGAEYNVSCFGRGYVQDLQQAAILGSSNLKQNQKIAYIISLQWFDNMDGVSPDNFAVNFSDIQFYKFLNNPKISDENKEYYAKRVYELLSKTNKYDAEAFYAKMYCDDSILSKIGRIVFIPYYSVTDYLSDIKDKSLFYKQLIALPDKDNDTELRTVDWNEEYEKVEEENNQVVSTNQFELSDSYYEKNVERYLDSLKEHLVNQNATISKEIQDFRFFLSVCDDLNLKPYIIMQPVNGWYYDFLGFDKEKRDDYYDTIEELSDEKDIDVLDLRDYDYKKGFLMDVMHLGNEGWLKVSEEIYKYFKEQ